MMTYYRAAADAEREASYASAAAAAGTIEMEKMNSSIRLSAAAETEGCEDGRGNVINPRN